MSERQDQNHEQRIIESFGPKFRIDVNNPQMGEKGTNVFLQYAVTDDNSRQFTALDESGKFMCHNEKDIEIISGRKTKSDVGIEIATLKGSIEITCQGDGNILIKGSNVVVEAREDISLKAGRNISLSASSAMPACSRASIVKLSRFFAPESPHSSSKFNINLPPSS